MPKPPPLRRYQLEPFRAILAAAEAHDADVLTVMMARQAGKNELSARAEGTLLATYGKVRQLPRTGVKAAPTKSPQADRSRDRLSSFLRQAGFRRPAGLLAGDDYVTLGTARWWFGSGEPGANVVGGTADLLLEFDEAQDFDQDKHDRDYAPMAAATAAARVYYGTALTDFDLLATMREHAAALQAKDGRRRVFDVPWTRVAEELPAYALFVETERARLGHTPETPHPAFRTQYELIPMTGAGRLLNPAQLAMLQGDHPPHGAPQTASHNVYVAGLDIGGANLSGAQSPDETWLTIGRSRFPGRGQTANPSIDVVAAYRWIGVDHDTSRGEIHELLTVWNVAHVAIDATGIGEPMAVHLAARLGERRVSIVKVTREIKSSLGYDMLAAVNTGALKIWRPAPADPLHGELLKQLRLCRSEFRAGKLLWHVDPRDGHDDAAFSLALLVRAAERGKPRIAQQASFR